MRKFLVGFALLAPASLTAQQSITMPSGSPTVGYPTTTGDGQRQPVQAVTLTDTNGNPISASFPLATAGGGASGGNTVDAQGNGTLALATANATYTIPLSGGRNAVGLTITGLTGSGATITVERSNNGGTIWTNANTTESSATGSLSATITADGQARVGVAGATNIRLRVSTAGTGTATIAYNATTAAGPVFFTGYLPSYTAPDGRIIGGVDNRFLNGTAISTGSGTTDAGTQRVLLATDGTQATAANQTSGTQKTQITDSAGNAVPITAYNGAFTPSSVGLQVRGFMVNYDPVANAFASQLGNGNGTYVQGSNASGATATGFPIRAAGAYRAAGVALADGQSADLQMTPTGSVWNTYQPSSSTLAGAAYTAAQGATSIVLKTGSGNLFGVNLVNSTVAGFLVVYNATTAPASGTALSAVSAPYCYQVAASTSYDKAFQIPIALSTGITLLFSTSCTTYTPVGTAPILISGQVK